ncbi:MAG: T9SS type A sorting domain-containing protein [Bacteroidia bacterium]|nr:T9SS type A sorting domain-containing protein [Bacteroidia bacterium]
MNKSLQIVILLFSVLLSRGQSNIGNYVSNGSFEALNSNSVSSYYNVVGYWSSLDTNKYAYYLATLSPPIANAPYAAGFQYPRSGRNYIMSTLYCTNCFLNTRGYPRNRLKESLKAGKAYCVKFYVVLSNGSNVGIDAIGAYFGDSTLDTISRCTFPITYLNPQITNPSGSLITDTLRWIPVTGTFVASGLEKYMLIGNFKSNSGTNTNVNPQPVNAGAEYCIDDVSVIEVNLPAYAGRDTTISPGTPVFLGREPDFAIDSGCTWYQWPNMNTPIYDKAGLWVNPVVTTTYIVKQILDCSPEKWDTVVVTVDPTVGYSLFDYAQSDIRVFPNPANGFIEFRSGTDLSQVFDRIAIYDDLGRLIREDGFKMKIKTEDLSEGIYSLQLSGASGTISKRVVIAR